MADRVDVKLKAKDQNNETTTTTISYVNPEASNSDMKQFAQKLNALTRNTYSESDKIETTNLDLAPDSGQQTPIFELSVTSKPLDDVKSNYTSAISCASVANVTYNGDGIPYAYVTNPTASNEQYMGVAITREGSVWNLAVFGSVNHLIAKIIHVRVDATENYKAAEAIFTIT